MSSASALVINSHGDFLFSSPLLPLSQGLRPGSAKSEFIVIILEDGEGYIVKAGGKTNYISLQYQQNHLD